MNEKIILPLARRFVFEIRGGKKWNVTDEQRGRCSCASGGRNGRTLTLAWYVCIDERDNGTAFNKGGGKNASGFFKV
jgi:hypothetical protein